MFVKIKKLDSIKPDGLNEIKVNTLIQNNTVRHSTQKSKIFGVLEIEDFYEFGSRTRQNNSQITSHIIFIFSK